MCDFLGGLKEWSLFPREHERHLLPLGGHQIERLEGILGGSGNLGRSISHSRQARDGGIVYACLCVCVRDSKRVRASNKE